MLERFGRGREDAVTAAGGAWLTIGLFLDGYAHENLLSNEGESILTPWHGVFYAGFTATAVWLLHVGRTGALGTAHRLTMVGLSLFAAGAVGDVGWHAVVGVERGIDALLSPTHLLLFAGLLLILTTPLRHRPESTAAVVAVGLAAALVGFFTSWGWGFGIAELTEVVYDPSTELGEAELVAGLASIALTTVVLCGAAVALAGTRPGVGAHAAVFAATAMLVTAAFEEGWHGVPAALAGGLVLDASVPRLRLIVVLPVSMLVTWSGYLALVVLTTPAHGWPAEIWAGAPVMAALLGAGIAWVGAPRFAWVGAGGQRPSSARRQLSDGDEAVAPGAGVPDRRGVGRPAAVGTACRPDTGRRGDRVLGLDAFTQHGERLAADLGDP